MNAALLQAVHDEQPDLVFFFLFGDEILPRTIEEITQHSGATTFNWFADDHFRWFNFSRYWAPLFHWVATTDVRALTRYRRIGYPNAILSQWACNHFTYKPSDGPYHYEVTFIGRPHSNRRRLVHTLEKAGICVHCWGYGWPNGRVSQEEMIQLFSRSKINLNFTTAAEQGGLKPLARVFLDRRADRSLRVRPPWEMRERAHVLLGKLRNQIKGRNFEIPGAGGFLLTGAVEHLEEYYVPGTEVAVFSTPRELVERVQFYLTHDAEREAVREAGYLRTLREHTYVHRFRAIFRTMGLDPEQVDRRGRSQAGKGRGKSMGSCV